MELTNDFRVALPVEKAWAVLTDLERIAPCMPGAQLQEIEGDEHRGVVKIKVGPITAQYKGKAVFVERNDETHVAVLRAEGRETRGQGNANATITAALVADGDGTAVSIITDLTVTGRVAQFGRGVLADVSAKLLDQFVESLESTVLVGEADTDTDAPAVGTAQDADAATADDAVDVPDELASAVEDAPEPDDAAAPTAPAIRRIDSPEPEPVNLLDAAGSPVGKRVGPILAAIAVLWLLKKLFSRRRA
ncbi:MAG: SRPBCC family protein [Microthrixaceae bacterium]